jgi:hypothetical protein
MSSREFYQEFLNDLVFSNRIVALAADAGELDPEELFDLHANALVLYKLTVLETQRIDQPGKLCLCGKT